MTLSVDAIEWAVQYVADHSDGDLFPRVAEMTAILQRKSEFAAEVAGKPLGSFNIGPHRRFIVPKDEVSYRQATQLHPQDSIFLSALMFQFGHGIEARRLPPSQVFSYRHSPTQQHGLYGNQSAWNDFWTTAATRGSQVASILYCDISDFYNQIAHHTVENQLIASGFPNQAVKWIVSLLESTTAGVSRGVPIGPHAAHLIAEASLIPVDNSMMAFGLEFIRYADDIIVFSGSEKESRRAIGRLANILDKQQRLILQKHKTRLMSSKEFVSYSEKMIEDRPINDEEDRVLQLVRKYSGGDPYRTISYNEVSAEDWVNISNSIVQRIIEEYIYQEEVDYIRLRWFYRRLAQIGHPGAIDVTLDNMDRLTPCFASISTYFASLQKIGSDAWLAIGAKLLALLEHDEVRDSEYFRLSVLSLFSRNPYVNHFKNLANAYAGSDPFAKREILLAAKAARAADWVREFKEDFEGLDQWQKMAFLYCCKDFPLDERKYFVNRWTFERPFEATLARWAKSPI